MTIKDATDDEITLAPREYTITRNVPYQVRWKILQIKLMLNDLKEIADKHQIPTARILYDEFIKEVEAYFTEIYIKIFRRKEGE